MDSSYLLTIVQDIRVSKTPTRMVEGMEQLLALVKDHDNLRNELDTTTITTTSGIVTWDDLVLGRGERDFVAIHGVPLRRRVLQVWRGVWSLLEGRPPLQLTLGVYSLQLGILAEWIASCESSELLRDLLGLVREMVVPAGVAPYVAHAEGGAVGAALEALVALLQREHGSMPSTHFSQSAELLARLVSPVRSLEPSSLLPVVHQLMNRYAGDMMTFSPLLVACNHLLRSAGQDLVSLVSEQGLKGWIDVFRGMWQLPSAPRAAIATYLKLRLGLCRLQGGGVLSGIGEATLQSMLDLVGVTTPGELVFLRRCQCPEVEAGRHLTSCPSEGMLALTVEVAVLLAQITPQSPALVVLPTAPRPALRRNLLSTTASSTSSLSSSSFLPPPPLLAAGGSGGSTSTTPTRLLSPVVAGVDWSALPDNWLDSLLRRAPVSGRSRSGLVVFIQLIHHILVHPEGHVLHSPPAIHALVDSLLHWVRLDGSGPDVLVWALTVLERVPGALHAHGTRGGLASLWDATLELSSSLPSSDLLSSAAASVLSALILSQAVSLNHVFFTEDQLWALPCLLRSPAATPMPQGVLRLLAILGRYAGLPSSPARRELLLQRVFASHAGMTEGGRALRQVPLLYSLPLLRPDGGDYLAVLEFASVFCDAFFTLFQVAPDRLARAPVLPPAPTTTSVGFDAQEWGETFTWKLNQSASTVELPATVLSPWPEPSPHSGWSPPAPCLQGPPPIALENLLLRLFGEQWTRFSSAASFDSTDQHLSNLLHVLPFFPLLRVLLSQGKTAARALYETGSSSLDALHQAFTRSTEATGSAGSRQRQAFLEAVPQIATLVRGHRALELTLTSTVLHLLLAASSTIGGVGMGTAIADGAHKKRRRLTRTSSEMIGDRIDEVRVLERALTSLEHLCPTALRGSFQSHPQEQLRAAASSLPLVTDPVWAHQLPLLNLLSLYPESQKLLLSMLAVSVQPPTGVQERESVWGVIHHPAVAMLLIRCVDSVPEAMGESLLTLVNFVNSFSWSPTLLSQLCRAQALMRVCAIDFLPEAAVGSALLGLFKSSGFATRLWLCGHVRPLFLAFDPLPLLKDIIGCFSPLTPDAVAIRLPYLVLMREAVVTSPNPLLLEVIQHLTLDHPSISSTLLHSLVFEPASQLLGFRDATALLTCHLPGVLRTALQRKPPLFPEGFPFELFGCPDLATFRERHDRALATAGFQLGRKQLFSSMFLPAKSWKVPPHWVSPLLARLLPLQYVSVPYGVDWNTIQACFQARLPAKMLSTPATDTDLFLALLEVVLSERPLQLVPPPDVQDDDMDSTPPPPPPSASSLSTPTYDSFLQAQVIQVLRNRGISLSSARMMWATAHLRERQGHLAMETVVGALELLRALAPPEGFPPSQLDDYCRLVLDLLEASPPPLRAKLLSLLEGAIRPAVADDSPLAVTCLRTLSWTIASKMLRCLDAAPSSSTRHEMGATDAEAILQLLHSSPHLRQPGWLPEAAHQLVEELEGNPPPPSSSSSQGSLTLLVSLPPLESRQESSLVQVIHSFLENSVLFRDSAEASSCGQQSPLDATIQRLLKVLARGQPVSLYKGDTTLRPLFAQLLTELRALLGVVAPGSDTSTLLCACLGHLALLEPFPSETATTAVLDFPAWGGQAEAAGERQQQQQQPAAARLLGAAQLWLVHRLCVMRQRVGRPAGNVAALQVLSHLVGDAAYSNVFPLFNTKSEAAFALHVQPLVECPAQAPTQATNPRWSNNRRLSSQFLGGGGGGEGEDPVSELNTLYEEAIEVVRRGGC